MTLNFFRITIFFGLLVLLGGCNFLNKDCDDVECFTPPRPFYFQLVDDETGEDLVDNDSIDVESVVLKDIEGETKRLYVDSLNLPGNFIFFSNEIGWETGEENRDYVLEIGDAEVTFVYETKELTADCCTFYEEEEVSSTDVTIEVDEERRYYIFLL